MISISWWFANTGSWFMAGRTGTEPLLYWSLSTVTVFGLPWESCAHDRTHKPTLTSAGPPQIHLWNAQECPGSHSSQDQIVRVCQREDYSTEPKMHLTAPDSQVTLQLKKCGFALYPGVPGFVNTECISSCSTRVPTHNPLQSLVISHLPTASPSPEVKDWLSSGA